MILLFLAGGLIAVNRDVFHFDWDMRLERTFTPEADEKRDYLIAGPLSLKPGNYVFSPELSAAGYGSAVFLRDADGEDILFEELPDGMENPSFDFSISGGARQVRVGIHYDPAGSVIRMNRLRITAEHVLYKDSLLRHAVVSLALILTALCLGLRLCAPQKLWKVFPWFARKENEHALWLLAGLTLAACYPLLDPATYVHGEDMFFHLDRIRGLAESLRAGYFPVRDQLYWLHNYGYGVGFYYPDLFLYLPAVMFLLGFSLLTAYKIFLGLFSFLSIASVWYTAKRISGSRNAAAAAAVWMAFASYRLSNVYYRGAVGETQAAVFYPLIILGLWEIFYGNRKRWPFFALGFFGMLSCHMISLTIAGVLTAVFLLTHIRRIVREREIIFILLKSVLLTLCLGAWFWMPMLEQTLTNPGLRINRLIETGTRLNKTNYAFPVRNLLLRFSRWNYAYQADCIYPGWSLLAIPLLRLCIWKKRDKPLKTADFLLLFSALPLWMCTRAFPWKLQILLPFVTRIQFAYRLLLPATVMLCLCGGICWKTLWEGRKAQWLPLAGLALFCFFSTAFPVLQESVLHRTVEKRMFVMQDNRVSGAEYLPFGLDSDFPDKNADSVSLSGSDLSLNVTSHKRQRLGFTFSYELPEDAGAVEFSLPLIWYTGFRGSLTDESGREIPLETFPDPRGLVSVGNEGIPRGTVSVRYVKTPVQHAGECLTLLTLAVCIILSSKLSGKQGKKKSLRV